MKTIRGESLTANGLFPAAVPLQTITIKRLYE